MAIRVLVTLFALLLPMRNAGAALSGADEVASSQPLPCSDKPNCVSSTSTDPGHFIEPLHYTDDQSAARARLLRVIGSVPRSRVPPETGDCIRATFTSLVFRFVDDVEFCFDEPGKRILMRSASRIGYSDFGVNRRRLELIRSRFRQPAG